MILVSAEVAVLGAVITIAGIITLTYAPMSNENQRIGKRRTKQLQEVAKQIGYKGTIAASGSYSNSHFTFGMSYHPADDDPEYFKIRVDIPKLMEPFQNTPFHYFWVNQNLIRIGIVVSVFGVVLGLVSQTLV